MRIRNVAVGVLLGGAILPATRAAHAAESYDNCAKFIDSLPATISGPGVYCLRHDLSTGMASGAAITIAANNVTIDCNDFKLGGLAAGVATGAYGIHATGRQNIAVRRCNVRGFLVGIQLDSTIDAASAGQLVEDNRLDDNRYVGIVVMGENNRVLRNRVYGTGGSPGRDSAMGIDAEADIEGNTVDGIASASGKYATGITALGAGSRVAGNRVAGLAATDEATGIDLWNVDIDVVGNHIVAGAAVQGYGIHGNGSGFCARNTVAGFVNSIAACQNAGGNDSL